MVTIKDVIEKELTVICDCYEDFVYVAEKHNEYNGTRHCFNDPSNELENRRWCRSLAAFRPGSYLVVRKEDMDVYKSETVHVSELRSKVVRRLL